MIRYFAEIDDRNIVLRVIVVESAEYAHELFGGNWVETFIDSDKNYAGVGSIFVPELNNFHRPKPYPNWVLNDKLRWVPRDIDKNIIIPDHIIPRNIITEDNKIYKWDNEISKWYEI